MHITTEWADVDRLIITDNDGPKNEYVDGVVLVDFIKDEKNRRFPRGTAYVWNLYVAERYRKFGIAKQLLCEAEQLMRKAGARAAFIEWTPGVTPRWVKEWYERLGYEVFAFGRPDDPVLLKKDLTREPDYDVYE